MQNGSGTFDPFLVLNNVNNFGKIKIGEQFQIKDLSLETTQMVIIMAHQSIHLFGYHIDG